MLTQQSEQQLVLRLCAREEKAMTYFYDNYRHNLYRAIRRLVGQNELAEDILQESMLKFWLAFPSYDAQKGRLYTWMMNISRNLAVDRLRNMRRVSERTEALTDDHAAELVAPATFWPEHIGVREWLAWLPASDHRLVELIYLEGHTHVEAADALALPLGTVKSRITRIVRVLASIVNQPPA